MTKPWEAGLGEKGKMRRRMVKRHKGGSESRLGKDKKGN